MLSSCRRYISVNFSQVSLKVYPEFFFVSKVGDLVFIICSLVVGIDYIVWLTNHKANESYILLNEKKKAALLSSI